MKLFTKYYYSSLFLMMMVMYSVSAWSVDVELVETSPKSAEQLNQGESLYVLIRYKSDQPLCFQAIGQYQNQQIKQNVKMNASLAYPAGEGNAIAWVAYYKSTKIDQLVVTVYNDNWQPIKNITLSRNVSWEKGSSIAPHQEASWVTKLNQYQQSYGRDEPATSFSWNIFLKLLFLMVPGYWVLQIQLLRTWKDQWRKRAAFPLIISVPLLLYTLFALFKGSNLWPLMMIFISPILFIVLLIIMFYKKQASE